MNPLRLAIVLTLPAAVLFGLLAVSPAHAETPPTLRFDPFREPTAAARSTEPNRREDPRGDFRPILRSTVVGGARPLANLGGEILAPGESVAGYRLVSVEAYEAVFEKDGQRLRLEVQADEESNR